MTYWQNVTTDKSGRRTTINSAYNSFEENIKGFIKAGKLADIVVFSKEILEIPLNMISETKVELTMVGGKVVCKLRCIGF